jgi:hypothetical protein
MSHPFPSQDQILGFEAAHKRIGVVTHTDGKEWCVVLRKPNSGEYKRFRAWSNQANRADMAQEQLFKDICVFPAGADLDALLEDWPGVPEACGRMLLELSGMTGIERGKV